MIASWTNINKRHGSGSGRSPASECLYGKYKSNNGADINKQRMWLRRHPDDYRAHKGFDVYLIADPRVLGEGIEPEGKSLQFYINRESTWMVFRRTFSLECSVY